MTGYVQPHSRDKHWSFFVSEYDVRPIVGPVIEGSYDDGDTIIEVKDHHGVPGTRRRNEHRRDLVAEFVATQASCGSVDFHHDPDAGEDPEIVRVDLTRVLTDYFDGRYDRHPWAEPVQPLLNDDFADPAVTRAIIGRLVDAVATGIADGLIAVVAEEPYDSCRNCGGYHNVNYDC